MQKRQDNLTGSKEEMANRIMANLIKQLASLGRHANDIFGKNRLYIVKSITIKYFQLQNIAKYLESTNSNEYIIS